MRRSMLCAATLVAALPMLVVVPANGVPAASGTSSNELYTFDGPWSLMFSYQTLAPADGGMCAQSDRSVEGTFAVWDERSSVSLYPSSGEEPCAPLSFQTSVASGKALTTGHYRNAQPWGGEDPERPTMEFGYDPCKYAMDADESSRGSFDVRELHRSAGRIDRLWVTFQVRCAATGAVLSGQARLGMQREALRVAPAAVTWPDQTFAGVRSAPVELDVRPDTNAPRLVDAAVVVGPGREHYEIVGGNCTGRRVGPDGCTVRVVFAPTSPGHHVAAVALVLRRQVVRVPLEARAIPAETRWDFTAEAGHPLVPGYPDDASSWSGSSMEAPSFAEIRRGSLAMGADSMFERPYQLYLELTGAAETVEGTTFAVDTDSDTAAPQASLLIDGEHCVDERGTVTVHQLDVAASGAVRRAHVTLDHVCDLDPDGEPAPDARLAADLRHRAQQDTEPPAKVRGLRLVRDPAGRVRVVWSTRGVDIAPAVVRWYEGRVRAARHPLAGLPSRRTGSNQAALPGSTDAPVTVSVFTYDEAGNVSVPTIARLD